MVCADFKDKGAGARGYTFRFLATIRDGVLAAQFRSPGASPSLRYAGTLDAQGRGEIRANGLTGPDTRYNVDRTVGGKPYGYRMKMEFHGNEGHATRLDLRPCEATFVRQ